MAGSVEEWSCRRVAYAYSLLISVIDYGRVVECFFEAIHHRSYGLP
ncbi:MAG: hypothetical protein QOH41_4278 [Blastocatellia bacterium]|jgi:hypothetical protein|nr:hypothetical protein [Blastocatellia bacterium]